MFHVGVEKIDNSEKCGVGMGSICSAINDITPRWSVSGGRVKVLGRPGQPVESEIHCDVCFECCMPGQYKKRGGGKKRASNYSDLMIWCLYPSPPVVTLMCNRGGGCSLRRSFGPQDPFSAIVRRIYSIQTSGLHISACGICGQDVRLPSLIVFSWR